eukprot:1509889-Rhodomonas_salina.1
MGAGLADPANEPDQRFAPQVDVALRHVADALLWEEEAGSEGGGEGARTPRLRLRSGQLPREPVGAALAYLRSPAIKDKKPHAWHKLLLPSCYAIPGTDVAYAPTPRERVGVPRDLSWPAARQLRAHVTAVIRAL